MERMRRLDSLWSWLPAFRAVAETQHLPTAAQWLCVTPPALSRSIRLLEEDLGQPLFDRIGRRLVLNASGQQLLRAVRLGMRSLDDAVSALASPTLRGPLGVAAPLPIQRQLVLPALAAVLEGHPDLRPLLIAIEGVDVPGELLPGALDLAITQEIEPHPDLRIDRLVSLTSGLFCGRRHPLFEAPEPTAEIIAAHPFVELLHTHSPWPADRPRVVAARVAYLEWALDLCLTGRYLAILPEALAEAHQASGALRALPMEGLASRTLYAVRRQPLRETTPEGALLREIARRVAARLPQEVTPL